MTRIELSKYKAFLEAKLLSLTHNGSVREGIAIERSADAIDTAILIGEREQAIELLDRESALLRNVRAALARLKGDCFGLCLQCDEEISPKRLNAVPWTPYCLKCQEASEQTGQAAERLFEDAA